MWVKPKFLDAVATVFKAEMQQYQLMAVEIIAWAYARMAYSNAIVGSPVLSEIDRANFSTIVMLGRRVMQGLIKCADNANVKLKYGFSRHKRLNTGSFPCNSNLLWTPETVKSSQETLSNTNTESEGEVTQQK